MAHPNRKQSDIEARVFAEQIAMIYRLTPHTLAMSVIGSTLILLAIWASTPHPLLLGWYLLHHVITLSRYLLIRAYRRAEPPPAAAPLWARRFVIGTIAAGLIWSTVGTALFPPPGSDVQFFTALFRLPRPDTCR